MTAIAGLLSATLDCGEPRELAAFYRRFVGGEIFSSNEDFAVLVGDSGLRLDFQSVANPRPPHWPDPEAARRVHLDFVVDDLAAAESRVLEAGAVVLDHQPGGDRFRVFADPAGHLFCLCRREAATVPIDRP
jgi:catechol 2,3-dioxygenase-like lactoylglutathione lyase family enzyme